MELCQIRKTSHIYGVHIGSLVAYSDSVSLFFALYPSKLAVLCLHCREFNSFALIHFTNGNLNKKSQSRAESIFTDGQ